VRHALAEAIVDFLSFSNDASNRVGDFKRFRPREWEHALLWLDDAGLAFYFLQKLKSTNRADQVPAWLLSQLEQNFTANQERNADMSRRFAALNQLFDRAGIRYVALKGLTLVPQFCPDSSLRYQGDFDYLVDEGSLPAAQQILLKTGYSPKPSPSSQEFLFLMSGSAEPSRHAEQYRAGAPHAIELHLDIWDSNFDKVPSLPKLFFVQHAITHQHNGLTFPALSDEDAFLLQVLHACHHFFSHWIRMSSLFEIGYFLNRRASDAALWKGIAERVSDSSVLREFVVVVTELVAKVFAAPIPEVVRAWGSTIRPGSRVWLDNYARHWAFCELPVHQFALFPRAKLIRFLHAQYKDDKSAPSPVQNRGTSPSRTSRIASSIRSQPSLLLNRAWWKRHLLVRRGLFHALAGLRYFCEIPRWMWLTRTRIRSASLDV
jgi:hypothetical protein